MAYVVRTKDNPGDVGRAADQQQSVDNEAAIYAAILGAGPVATGGMVKQFVKKTGMVDNTATVVFTVTTTNEAGDNDGGVYGLRINGIACHGIGPTGETSAVAFTANASRSVNAAASAGSLSTAVIDSEHWASSYSAAATKSITSVALTVVETSEYVVTYLFTIDCAGTTVTTGEIYAMVEMIYAGFTTPPVITSAG